MAVYTHLTDNDITAFLSDYDIGNLINKQEIIKGVENSNYLLTTSKGKFILTIFEKRVKEDDLPFFFALTDHLASKGFPCPTRQKNKQGNIIGKLKDKPAAIVSFLKGEEKINWGKEDCFSIGRKLAEMHELTKDFNMTRANDLSLNGWLSLWEECNKRNSRRCIDNKERLLTFNLEQYLQDIKNHWQNLSQANLPAGICHADLFPDNVFFNDQNEIVGVIDFYFACHDFLAYDLAITITAWCFNNYGDRSPLSVTNNNIEEIIKGYQSIRPLADDEAKFFPLLVMGASMRFTLTRFYDVLMHDSNHKVSPKDYTEYYAILDWSAQPQNQQTLQQIITDTRPK